MEFNIFFFIFVFIVISAIVYFIALSFTIEKGNIEGPENIRIINSRKIVVREAIPSDLVNYKFIPNKTGIYSNWDTSEVELGVLANEITCGLTNVIIDGVTKNNKYLLDIADDFTLRFFGKLSTIPVLNKGPLWGDNWYQFSVSVCTTMGYYILVKECKYRNLAVTIILALIQDPEHSVGYTFNGVNSIYLAANWILASYYNGRSFESIDKDLTYCNTITSPKYVTTSNSDGLHIDGTFYSHNGVIGFKYLNSLDSFLCRYYYTLNPVKTNLDLKQNAQYLRHPTIPVAPLGMGGREDNLKYDTNSDSPMGLKVFPSCRFIRYFTPEYRFSLRGQIDKIAFFEADKSVSNTGQYWVQYRGIMDKNTSSSIGFPELGFININNEDKLIDLPSRTKATDARYPTSARSFVFAYNNFGILYQEYRIVAFFDAVITETIIFDTKLKQISLYLSVNNNNPDGIDLQGYYIQTTVPINGYKSKLTKVIFKAKTVTNLAMLYDLDKSTISNLTPNTISVFKDNIKVDNTTYSIKLSDDSNWAILYVNNKAALLAPYGIPNEYEKITTKVDKVDQVYQFNKVLNQYKLV